MAERRRSPQGGPSPACEINHCGTRAFRVVGDLDATSAEKLLYGLAAEIEVDGDLVLDLADLESADCNGTSAIAEIASRLDGDLILLSPRPTVTIALESAKICERFPNVVLFCTHRPRS